MARKTKAKARGPGRPRTGIGTQISVRAHADFIKRIDAWRAKQPDIPTRPAAILRLAAAGLAAGRS
jgi:hypothetical protein